MVSKKFCVIGTGRFGYQVATTLAHNGMEVLAVDSNEAIISSIRDKVTQAICLRVTDEEALIRIGAGEMDVIIVAMGENFAQSILVTAILKQKLKVPMVITRSISEIHKDILALIGADQVILPEQEVGQRLADTLSLPFHTLARLSPQFCISQLKAPALFVQKSLKDLDLFSTYQVICLGTKKDGEVVPLPSHHKITEDDLLIIAGTTQAVGRLVKL